MPGDNLYTDAEITIAAVARYVSAFHFAQTKQGELTPEWPLVMDNLVESMRVLDEHQDGHQLLLAWYGQKTHCPRENIHQFINQLWADFARDHVQVRAISNHYFRRCVWEFMFGAVLCIGSPTVLVLLLPLLANPVILAPVFILTCIMLPLLAHFLLINPGRKNLNASQTLDQALSYATPSESVVRPFRDVFFKESKYDSSKAEITAQYNVLNNAAPI